MKKIKFYAILAVIVSIVSLIVYSFAGPTDFGSLIGIEEVPEVNAKIAVSNNKSSNNDALVNTEENVSQEHSAVYEKALSDQNQIARQAASINLAKQPEVGAVVIDQKLLNYGVERAKKKENEPTIIVERNCVACQALNEEQIDERISQALEQLKKEGKLSGDGAKSSLLDKILNVLLPNGRSARLVDGDESLAFIIDEDGVLIDPLTGKPIIRNGKVMTRADLQGSGVVLSDGFGNYFDGNGNTLVKEKLDSSDLVGMTYGGKETYVDENGQLRYMDGSPVLDENGNPIYYDEELGFVNASGEPSALGDNLKTANGESISADGSKFALANGGAEVSKTPISKDQLNSMLYDGKETYVDENGQLRYMDGSPVLDENGNPIFWDEELGFVDADGSPSNLGDKLTTADGKPITADGDVINTTDATPISAEELDGLTYNGRETYIGEDGQLYYADGSPVLDENGEAIFYDPDKGFVNADGSFASVGDALKTSDGKFVTASGSVINTDQNSAALSDSQLDGILYGGRETFIGEDGQLYYADGSPVLDQNGEAIFYDPELGFVNASGEASEMGNNLIVPGKISDDQLEGILYGGRETFIGEDGQLYYADGSPVLDENGEAIFYDPELGFVNASGEASEMGDNLFVPAKISEEQLEGILYGGRETFIGEDGQLYYADGSPVLDENGEAIFYDPVLGFVNASGEASKLGDNLVIPEAISEEQLEGMLYGGRETYIGEDGQLYYADGSPVLDENGEAIFYDPEKGFVNANGEASEMGDNLTTADGKTITADGNVLSEFKNDLISNAVLDGMTYGGRETYIGEDGQLYYADGSPVLDENGEAIYYDPVKGFVNASGEASSMGDKLTTADGQVISANGDVEKLSDEMLEGLTYGGRETYIGEDGQLYYADGSPVLDENGEAIFYDPEKGFVNASGEMSSIGDKLRSENGDLVTANGSVFGTSAKSDISEEQLEGMLYGGRETYIGEDGQLYYADGSPVLDENGEAVFYDPDKGFVNADGSAANIGDNLTTADGKLVTADGGVLNTLVEVLASEEDLEGMLYGGRETYIDENGQVRYMDGSPVLDENGEAVFYDPELGFVNGKGEASSLGNNLTTASGELMTSDGTVLRLGADKQNGFDYQVMDRSLARIAALELENQIGSSIDTAESQNTLGNFYLSVDRTLQSPDREELLLSNVTVLLEMDNAAPDLEIMWDGESLSFVRTGDDIKPIIFSGKRTGILYNAKGEKIDKSSSTLLLYVDDDSIVHGANGVILHNNKKVYVNENNELVNSAGIVVQDTRNKTLYFDKDTGVYNADNQVGMIAGILTDFEGYAIDHLGKVLKNNDGVQEWFYNLSNLSNGIILRDGKPIYDQKGIKLRGVRQEIGTNKYFVFSNLQGTTYDDLKITNQNDEIVLTKNDKVISPFTAFIFNAKGIKEPLAKADFDFEIVGTGLFVSKNGLVFSDRNLHYLVMDSRMQPVTFNGRTLESRAGLIKPIVDLSSNSYGKYLTNIDGSYLYVNNRRVPINDEMTVTNALELIENENTEISLFPSLVSDDPIVNSIGDYTISSKGVLYKDNRVINSELNATMTSDGQQFSSTIVDKQDAPVLPDNLINITSHNDFFIVNGNRLMADKDGLIRSEDYTKKDNRFISDSGIVTKLQTTLVSFASPLISNGKIINYEYLDSSTAFGDLKLVGNLLVNENGELLQKDGQWVFIDENGVMRNLLTGEIIQNPNGATILDRRNGLVDDKGQPANFDYLETASGKRYDELAKLASDKTLSKKVNLDNFLFDDENQVYTDKEIPVIINDKHISVDDNNNVQAGDVSLEHNGDSVKLTNDGLTTNDGEVISEINDEGEIVNKGLLTSSADYINGLFSSSKSNLQKLKEGFNKATILPVRPNTEDDGVVEKPAVDETPPVQSPQPEVVSQPDNQQQATQSTTNNDQILGLNSLTEGRVLLNFEDSIALSTFSLEEVQVEVDEIEQIVLANFQSNSSGSVTYEPEEDGANTLVEGVAGAEADNLGNDAKAYVELASVINVPDDAYLLFRKGDRLRAKVDAPYSTASSQGVFMPTVRLTSGELRGSILEATNIVASASDLTLVFGDTFRLPNGKNIVAPSTFAMTIDPETGFPGSGAEVDNHFWSKFLRIAPFALIDKWGEWTESKLEEVTTDEDTDEETTTVSEPSTEELALIVAGEAADEGRTLIQSEIDALTREISLWRGQEVHIIISEDVYVREEDLYR